MSTSKRFSLLRLLASFVSLVVVVLAGISGWFYLRMKASLPTLDGTAALPGLSAPATLARDAAGVPTLRGANRFDVSRALGYAHAQDRLFQMDVLRRRAAGELAEIFGSVALPLDRSARRHAFRDIARQVVADLPADQRTLLEAYTAGVNAGRTALGSVPFEYLALRVKPVEWLPEDSILVSLAMVLDLQDDNGGYEQSLNAVRDSLGPTAYAFFAPLVGPNDAALDSSTAPLPEIPGPKSIDLRKAATSTATTTALEPEPLPGALAAFDRRLRDPDLALGSNSFGLAGARTASGAALIAGDMHLGLSVPNVWYRAQLAWTDADGEHTITGVTLPGTPLVVAGSNGHVAWAFTNSYIDTSDLVIVDANSIAPDSYYARGTDMIEYEKRRSTIHVKGGDDVTIETRWTVWGPIVGKNLRGKSLALKWTAHDPHTTNLELLGLEKARTVEEALTIAHRTGITPQNLLVGDRSGALAWTIIGDLPKRRGFDGRLPVAWTFGDRGWDGYLTPEETPVVRVAPDGTPSIQGLTRGQLFSANARMLGGPALVLLGDGHYARPARAAQIRDDLHALMGQKATPADLLAIQLDDRALFLSRWQQRLATLLDDDAVRNHADRAKFQTAIRKWEGRASVESVSYRLVRAWRTAVLRRVATPIFASCSEAYPEFSYTMLPLEEPVWTLLEQQPAHLLDPAYSTWRDLELAAVDDVLHNLDETGVPIERATWGAQNIARIQHPVGRALPGFLARRLNMPAQPLPGDTNMPRVQGRGDGASQRTVVSPGRETEGIHHQPGGASGHPLSPFYRAGHAAWVEGRPTPFLPGPATHTLTLTP